MKPITPRFIRFIPVVLLLAFVFSACRNSGAGAENHTADTEISDNAMICTLSVSCGTLLDNMDKLDEEKRELVPEDGLIFPAAEAAFYEGDSVFDVLRREMEKNKIHLEFVEAPMNSSVYIEGIHNLYEFDCGELSGWTYKVNEQFPNVGCSRYQLQDGDVIEWVYTCDAGRDVGNTAYAAGGGSQM